MPFALEQPQFLSISFRIVGRAVLLGRHSPMVGHMGDSLLFSEQMETKHVIEIMCFVSRGRMLAASLLQDTACQAFCSG